MRPIVLPIVLATLLPLGLQAQTPKPTAPAAPAAAPKAPSSTIIVPAAPTSSPAAITPAPAPAAPEVRTAEAAPITPEAMAEAKQLTDLLGIPNQTKAVLNQVRGQVIQATINASGKSIAEASAIADEIIMPEFQAHEAELAQALVAPWALGFTVQEMKDLRAFYNTTLGKRLLSTMPTVTQQSVQIGQQWMQTTFREAVIKHGDTLRAKGLKF